MNMTTLQHVPDTTDAAGRGIVSASASTHSASRNVPYSCFVLLLTHVALLAATSVSARAGLPLPTGQPADGTAVSTLITSLKVEQTAISGRGIATVTETTTASTTERLLLFCFKNGYSRADEYQGTAAERGTLERAWSRGPKGFINYGRKGNSASVATIGSEFDRRLGYDFHPATFLSNSGQALYQALEFLRGEGATFYLHAESATVLRIEAIVTYSTSAVTHLLCRVDTSRGNVVLSWQQDTTVGQPPGARACARYDCDWRDGPIGLYIASATAAHFSENRRDRLGNPSDSRTTTTIHVREVTANPAVQDEEFTVAGMKLPVNTLIVDQIAGINYRLGQPGGGTGPLTEETLLKGLAEMTVSESPRRSDEAVVVRTEGTRTSWSVWLAILTLPVGLLVVLAIRRWQRAQAGA